MVRVEDRPSRYGDKIDLKAQVTGANGGPFAIDHVISPLGNPDVVARLDESEVAAIRSGFAKSSGRPR